MSAYQRGREFKTLQYKDWLAETSEIDYNLMFYSFNAFCRNIVLNYVRHRLQCVEYVQFTSNDAIVSIEYLPW